jgi:hypothetical protein
MKAGRKIPLFAVLILGAMAAPLQATHLGLVTVKQAVYLHGSDSDARIEVVDVPFVTSHADPEWRFGAIGRPFVPPTDGSWKSPGDVNLASLYRIKISGLQTENGNVEVVIDLSEAVVPEGYPFTIDQVLEAVTTCVRLMYPARPVDEGVMTLKVVRPPGDQVKPKDP